MSVEEQNRIEPVTAAVRWIFFDLGSTLIDETELRAEPENG